jgi:hypothetical protein
MSYRCKLVLTDKTFPGGPRSYKHWTRWQDSLFWHLWHARVKVQDKDYYLPMGEIAKVLGRTAQSCFMRRQQGPFVFETRPQGSGSTLTERAMIAALKRHAISSVKLDWGSA